MIIKILALFIPSSFKKKKLLDFFSLTADAFKTSLPNCENYSYKDCLQKFAIYTKNQAQVCIEDRLELERTKQRLYVNAYNFGKMLRNDFKIEILKIDLIIFMLAYKLIGIDIKFEKVGEANLSLSEKKFQFTVSKCYFSNLYSKNICELISFLDKGFANGLTGSSEFYFSQRITEGCEFCSGYIKGRLQK